jgi:ATP-dependent Lhr-like helicase
MVLQYGSPRQVARLVQRVGRGGHRERETSYGKIIVGNYIDALESLAIIGQMRRGSMEKHRMEELAMDVLANQICGMALEYKRISAESLYRIACRAAPYKGLKKDAFEKLLDFLAEEKLVRMKDGLVGIGSRCREYFFSNISVIPDTTRFFVRDAASNRTISSLDEKFVSNYLDEGSVFITKGLPWKVISIEEGTVFVEPSVEFEAAIPDWEGEDIPVSYATAQGAYELMSKGVSGYDDVLEGGLRRELETFISAQKKHFLPDGGGIVVEELDDYAIIHAALGKLANEFLAKLIGNVASQLSGSRLLTKATPYAIIVDYSGARKKPDIRRVLETIKDYSAESALGSGGGLANTELFRYKFIRVCKLFGVVSRKAVVTKHDADRLIRFYKESPIFEEAFRDLKKNNIDAETAMNFLNGIKKGAVGIRVLGGALSPLADQILKASYSYRELLLPALPDDATIREFGDKIGAKRLELLCTFCGLDFFKNIDIDSKEKVACARCASPMVCIYGDEKASAVRKRSSSKPLGDKERGAYRDALKEASLVEAYGNKALAALSTYGIGPVTAARVLRLLRKDKRQFLIDLLEAQKTFIKTKKYWK